KMSLFQSIQKQKQCEFEIKFKHIVFTSEDCKRLIKKKNKPVEDSSENAIVICKYVGDSSEDKSESDENDESDMSDSEIAKDIQDEIYNTLGLTISIGVSFSKTLAKLGSDMKKPKGLVEINKQNHLSILKKLKVEEMIFIGKRTAKKLKSMNIISLFDLLNYNPQILEKTFGIMGKKIYEMALGINDDNVEVVNIDNTKSVGNGETAPKDMTNLTDVKNMISHLADIISARMRRHNFKAKTIHLSIKFADFSHLGAQKTYTQSFSSRESIFNYSLEIFHELTNYDFNPIRSIRVCCSNLEKAGSNTQISFLENEKKEKLGKALDNIRDKYGKDSIILLNEVEEI
ncbi:MAG: hypothetical protein IJX26_02745, partial [Clostridia bacterium]|nr:hypothetical protein [Clostridia bacterium]